MTTFPHLSPQASKVVLMRTSRTTNQCLPFGAAAALISRVPLGAEGSLIFATTFSVFHPWHGDISNCEGQLCDFSYVPPPMPSLPNEYCIYPATSVFIHLCAVTEGSLVLF